MKRIALVEDNPDNRLLVQAMLDDRYTIIEYENGKDALEGIAQDKPDLVLLDISLPGMDGEEVLSQIRADERLKDLYIIALTAHAMAGDREHFLQLGFDNYISKPILDMQLLIETIEYGLSR
ncbi:MAG: response regulator [bacterium]|jgi:CheY-like chemotaxis protein|nr:response regulator [bacterium]